MFGPSVADMFPTQEQLAAGNLNQAKRRLIDLADAFRKTGNEKVACELSDIAGLLYDITHPQGPRPPIK